MLGEDESVDSSNLLLAVFRGVADTLVSALAPAPAAAAILEFWKPPYRAWERGVAWTR